MADQAKTGHVGHSVDGKLVIVRRRAVGGCGLLLVIDNNFCGRLVQRRHGRDCSFDPGLLRDSFFNGGGNHAGSESLG